MMSLEKRAENVSGRPELAAFLDALADSLVERPEEEEWENIDLESFLRAWSAWLADSDGYFKNRGEDPPHQPTWSFVAKMFLAAKIYE